MPTFGRTSTASSSGNRRGSVVVEGVDVVASSFTRKAHTIGPLAGAAAVLYARKAADQMRSTVPVDRGDVRDSIESDDAPTVEGTTVYADAGPTSFVGKFLEEGTVKMAPRPYVQPAADSVIPEFVQAIKRLA